MRGQRLAPAALYPRERPGTHCTGGWWAPGPVWRGAENLASRIRSPDCPARRQSLHGLHYPAHDFSGAVLILIIYEFSRVLVFWRNTSRTFQTLMTANNPFSLCSSSDIESDRTKSRIEEQMSNAMREKIYPCKFFFF